MRPSLCIRSSSFNSFSYASLCKSFELPELPPDFLTSLAEGGYQLASQAELDELLETLDELLVN